jgi:type I restriction enzyme S subunit
MSAAFGLRQRPEEGGRAASEDLSGYRVVESGWLVVNKLSARDGALAVSKLHGIVSPAYWVLRLNEDLVWPRFLHYYLRSSPVLGEIWRRSKFMLPAQFDLPWDQFRSLHLDLPPLDQQRSIADFLDGEVARVDAAQDATRELDSRLRERARVVVREGVAGTLHSPRESSRLPWLGGLGAGTGLRPLGRTLRLQRGVDLTADDQLPGPYPVVTTAGVSGRHHRPIVRNPGVVVGRYGSVGNVHWIDGPHWPHNTTLYVSDYMGNYPKYIYYLLRAYPWDALHSRSAVPGVNRNDMTSDPVPVVALSEQGQAVRLIEESLSQIALSADSTLKLVSRVVSDFTVAG